MKNSLWCFRVQYYCYLSSTSVYFTCKVHRVVSWTPVDGDVSQRAQLSYVLRFVQFPDSRAQNRRYKLQMKWSRSHSSFSSNNDSMMPFAQRTTFNILPRFDSSRSASAYEMYWFYSLGRCTWNASLKSPSSWPRGRQRRRQQLHISIFIQAIFSATFFSPFASVTPCSAGSIFSDAGWRSSLIHISRFRGTINI